VENVFYDLRKEEVFGVVVLARADSKGSSEEGTDNWLSSVSVVDRF